MKDILKWTLSLLTVAVWAYANTVFLIVVSLMSLDEEWRGWGDVLLNPYIMVPYVLFTCVAGIAVWWIARKTVVALRAK